METLPELPARTLDWAKSVAPHPIVDVAPIGGGITNTKWILELAEGGPLVMRWAAPTTWGAVGREHVRREALACQLLADSTLPVPELVASDLDGTSAGGPANLLTWRPGRTRLDRLGAAAVAALARSAVAVHRQSVPTTEQPPTFSFRGPSEPEVPGWARWPNLWRQAIGLFAAGAPPTSYGLLHRDFHFGNTLWQEDEVTGLIDWAETSWGPPDLDVAHLCSDFAMMHTPADAEIFRVAYLREGGQLDPDPNAARFWMISDILGFLPDPAHILPAVKITRPDLSATQVRQGLEGLLALALEW
jgi:aminoglycoside phosphotransferase (APT) family kinase protein